MTLTSLKCINEIICAPHEVNKLRCSKPLMCPRDKLVLWTMKG